MDLFDLWSKLYRLRRWMYQEDAHEGSFIIDWTAIENMLNEMHKEQVNASKPVGDEATGGG